MALSGSTGANIGSNWRLELDWKASQDIGGNASTVTVDLYWKADAYGAIHAGTVSKSGYITIDGQRQNFTNTATLSNGQRKKIASVSKRVGHGSNGKKSFSISANFGMAVTLSGTYYGSKTISGSWTLNDIPRVSGASLNKTTVNYGETVRINISKADSSFQHVINGNWNQQAISISGKTSASYVDWTVPTSLMNNIPNGTSSWGTIWVDTYSGNTKVGFKELRLTTNVPNNVVPSFSSLTVAEQNSAATFVGGFVQGISKLKLTVNGASAPYGASVKSYSINFDGQLRGNNGIWEPKYSGTKTATATITDSRGRKASKSISISVIAYSPPTIGTLVASRNNEGKGTQVTVTRTGSLSSLNGKNQVSLIIDSSPKGEDTWGNPSSSTGAIGTTTFNGQNILPNAFSISSSFDIRIRVSDKFNTVTATTTISSAYYTLSLAKEGVGIGKLWQRGSLDMAGDVYSDGKFYAYGGLEIAGNSWDPRPEGFSGIQMNNSDIRGANGIYFNDPANTRGEGLLFLKSGKPNDSPNDVDYDTLFVLDGSLNINNIAHGDILWSGSSLVTTNQVVRPSKKISECPNGWILVWSGYKDQTIQNYDHNFTLTSKSIVSILSGSGVHFPIGETVNKESNMTTKYCYITDTEIRGHAVNGQGTRADKTLTQVIAW